MSTLSVTRQSTFYINNFPKLGRTSAFTSVFLSKRKNITTMTTPICTNIRQRFKTMWNSMIKFLLIRVLKKIVRTETNMRTYRFSISFTDTLRNNFTITFFMTRVFAVFTLITSCIFKEFSTKCTTHDLIELLHNEFMTVDFMHFFFSLTNGSLATETTFKWTFTTSFLNYS